MQSSVCFDKTNQKTLQPLGQPENKQVLDDALRCSQCTILITQNKFRIAMNGQHEHSFFNPQGIVFQIGCFSNASGLRTCSPPSGEFSWFPPFQWQVVQCSNCTAHLGWYFQNAEQYGFWGLILNRLRASYNA